MNSNDRFERYQATHRNVTFPHTSRPVAAPSPLRDVIARANSTLVIARAALALRGPVTRRARAPNGPDVFSDAFIDERANGRNVDPFQALQSETANAWSGPARASDASERANSFDGGDPFERLQNDTANAWRR